MLIKYIFFVVHSIYRIHPRYKQDVAARLAHTARSVVYKEKGLHYQGPFPTKFRVDNQTIEILYQNEGSGSIRLVGSLTNTFEVRLMLYLVYYETHLPEMWVYLIRLFSS